MKNRLYLDVSYKDKDEAKDLGAKWDFHENIRKWYIDDITEWKKFQKWIPNKEICYLREKEEIISNPIRDIEKFLKEEDKIISESFESKK